MPLQIRRGTNAERLANAVPFAVGELIYVTDTNKLYIGDGSMYGVQVTGFDATNAIDAVAGALIAGVNTNISFTYGTTQQLAGRIDAAVSLDTLLTDLDLDGNNITGTGGINITGDIAATNITAHVLADDATELINSTTKKINLNGTVQGNIIPDADVSYDIGANGARFRDLWLSGTSIHLGTALITASGTSIDIPAGSTIDGNQILAANAQGVFQADLNGSVFADDSMMIIDSTEGLVVGDVNNNSTSSLTFTAGSTTTNGIIKGYNTVANFTEFNTITGTGTSAWIDIQSSRGSLTAPTATQDNDPLSGILLFGHNGTTFKRSVIIGGYQDGALVNNEVPGAFIVNTMNSTGTADNELTFDSRGVLTAPVVKVTGYATGSEPANPEEGWMIFNSSTKKFLGFNGTSWVELG